MPEHEITGPHDREGSETVEYGCTCGTWTCVADPSDEISELVFQLHDDHVQAETRGG